MILTSPGAAPIALPRRRFLAAGAAAALGTRGAKPEIVVPDAKLRRIRMATIAGSDLHAIEAWYAGALGYRVRRRGTVSAALAASWGAPAMAGRAFAMMGPESGDEVGIRAVAIDPIAAPTPLTTWGWSAIEIAVADLDKLYARLTQGWLAAPIQLLGPPHPLAPGSPIYAMQIAGPAGEVLYLTANTGDRAKSNHPEPRSLVDRPFIAVLAGPDLAALRTFYGETFALADQGETSLPVPSRAAAHKLPADHVYTIDVAVCAERGNKIELDGFPREATGPQPHAPDQLPPGTAIMSFSVADVRPFARLLRTPPQRLYDRAEAGTLIGPAGERTELIGDRA